MLGLPYEGRLFAEASSAEGAFTQTPLTNAKRTTLTHLPRLLPEGSFPREQMVDRVATCRIQVIGVDQAAPTACNQRQGAPTCGLIAYGQVG